MEVLLDNYYGSNNKIVKLLEYLAGLIPEGMAWGGYTSGAMLKYPREIKEAWAAGMAQTADFVVVCADNSNGGSDSAKVVQFYLTDTHVLSIFPFHHLIDLERLILKVDENKALNFMSTPQERRLYSRVCMQTQYILIE